MDNDNAELTPAEAESFADLRRDREPPPELEERIVEGLVRRGGLRREYGGRGGGLRWLAAAAVLIVAVGASYATGRATAPPRDLFVQPTATAYALLVYEAPENRLLPVSQSAFDDTSRWISGLRDDGIYEGGAQLDTAAGLVALVDGAVVPAAGPPADASRVLSGFLLIVAPDLARAQQIAATSPLLRAGYTIEVREIIPDG